MHSGTLHALLWLALALLVSSGSCVTVQLLAPNKLVAEAAYYQLRIENSTISMHTRSLRSGLIREEDYLQYYFQGWQDKIFWSYTPNNSSTECAKTLTPVQNFTGPFTVGCAAFSSVFRPTSFCRRHVFGSRENFPIPTVCCPLDVFLETFEIRSNYFLSRHSQLEARSWWHDSRVD